MKREAVCAKRDGACVETFVTAWLGTGAADRPGGWEHGLSSQAVQAQILGHASFSSTYNREGSKGEILDCVVRS